MIETALRRVVGDLVAGRVRFALVGGFAVSVRAEPRLTRDIDFAVATTDDPMAEGIVRSLVGRGYEPDTVVEHESGRLAAARLSVPDLSEVAVDLLFASSGIEPEIVESAEAIGLRHDLRWHSSINGLQRGRDLESLLAALHRRHST